MSAILFDNDSAYHHWLSANPHGFVVNTRKSPAPSYMVLHRATCHRVRSGHSHGAFTQHDYRKVCAPTLEELRIWARRNGSSNGEFSKHCARCSPLGW